MRHGLWWRARSRRTMTSATAPGAGPDEKCCSTGGRPAAAVEPLRREAPAMAAVPAQPPIRSVSLKREIGLIGLLWASTGSIIGSGWLFSAQKGLIAAGPAAVISWVI